MNTKKVINDIEAEKAILEGGNRVLREILDNPHIAPEQRELLESTLISGAGTVEKYERLIQRLLDDEAQEQEQR